MRAGFAAGRSRLASSSGPRPSGATSERWRDLLELAFHPGPRGALRPSPGSIGHTIKLSCSSSPIQRSGVLNATFCSVVNCRRERLELDIGLLAAGDVPRRADRHVPADAAHGPRPRARPRSSPRAERPGGGGRVRCYRGDARSGELGRVVQSARHGPSAWARRGREAGRREEAREPGSWSGDKCHAAGSCNMKVSWNDSR